MVWYHHICPPFPLKPTPPCLQALLDVTGHPHLLANQTTLRRLLEMRNPYIEPLNILQVGGWLTGGAAREVDGEAGCRWGNT